MTNVLRPFLFAKALYLDWRQRKRMQKLQEETLAKVETILNDNIPMNLELGHSHIPDRDWLTMDENLNCDFYWDYRDGLPFPSGSIDVLFTRNTLQRLSSHQLDFLLEDCFRVLKPGGVFFLSVPDAEPILKAYAEKRRYLDSHPEALWKPGWHETGSNMDQVTYKAYCNGHAQFMFDRENVVSLCRIAGFTPTELRSPDPKIDGLIRDPDTLYVMARKPA